VLLRRALYNLCFDYSSTVIVCDNFLLVLVKYLEPGMTSFVKSINPLDAMGESTGIEADVGSSIESIGLGFIDVDWVGAGIDEEEKDDSSPDTEDYDAGFVFGEDDTLMVDEEELMKLNAESDFSKVVSSIDWNKNDILGSPKGRARAYSLEFSLLPDNLNDLNELEKAMKKEGGIVKSETTSTIGLESSSPPVRGTGIRVKPPLVSSPYLRKFKYKRFGGKTPAKRSPQNVERLLRSINESNTCGSSPPKPRYTYNTSDRWDPIQPLFAVNPSYTKNKKMNVFCKFTGAQLAFVKQPNSLKEQHRIHRTRLKQVALKLDTKAEMKKELLGSSKTSFSPEEEKKRAELEKQVAMMREIAKKEEEMVKAAQAKAAAARAAYLAAQQELEQGSKKSNGIASDSKVSLNAAAVASQLKLNGASSFSSSAKTTLSSLQKNASNNPKTSLGSSVNNRIASALGSTARATKIGYTKPSVTPAAKTLSKSTLGSSILKKTSITSLNRSSILRAHQPKASRVALKRPVGFKGKLIGNYTPEERIERVKQFLEKRKHRVWKKKVKYGCRKKLADSRPRVKGRFVPRSAVVNGVVVLPPSKAAAAKGTPVNSKKGVAAKKTPPSKKGGPNGSTSYFSKATKPTPSAKAKTQPRYGSSYTAKIQKSTISQQYSKQSGLKPATGFAKGKISALASHISSLKASVSTNATASKTEAAGTKTNLSTVSQARLSAVNKISAQTQAQPNTPTSSSSKVPASTNNSSVLVSHPSDGDGSTANTKHEETMLTPLRKSGMKDSPTMTPVRKATADTSNISASVSTTK